MTEQEKCSYCELQINDMLKPFIEKAILNHFGVTVDIKATIHKGGYVNVEDVLGHDVDKKMRANKILRTLFSHTYLYGTAWFTEEADTVSIRFNVGYNHVDGGSNGHEIGILHINTRNHTVRWNKYINY